MIEVIRAADYREGRWKNGLGVSWDIASDPPQAGIDDFGWRFAIARIDGGVPFSPYSGVDRVFTLLDGDGLTLELEGSPAIGVGQPFVPHHFSGDVATTCRLHGGPCRALNLFLKRSLWRVEVTVAPGHASLNHHGPVLLFALEGSLTCNGEHLAQGDAMVAMGRLAIDSGDARHYRAMLQQQ